MTDEPRCDLVIADCDAVLVESEPIVNRVFVELLAERRFSLDDEQILRELSGASRAPDIFLHAAFTEMSGRPGLLS